MHYANALIGELVNLGAAVRARIRALLLGPSDVAIRFARQQRQSIDEVIETAAAQGVNIIGWQVPIAGERLEDTLDVAFGHDCDLGSSALVEDGSIAPARVARGRHCLIPRGL